MSADQTPARKKAPRSDFSRLDWRREEIGRITVASGAANRREWTHRQGLLSRLYDAGQWDTLRAVKAGELSMRELVAAEREGRLLRADLLGDLHLRKPLWATLEATIRTLGKAASTRREYRSVLAGLATRGVLAADATVGDLLRVDWLGTVRAQYGSPANWNHLGRMLSAALSRILGDRHHPLRREFMKRFGGLEKEPKGKVVTLSAAQATRLLAWLPDPIRPAVVVLMATGVRVGEYLASTPADYDPESGQWWVTGKTGRRDVIVPASARPWMAAALPFPWGYRTLYNWIKKAGAAIGKPALTVHDLRHAATVWVLDQGATLEDARDMLGHDDVQTTGRYARSQRQAKTAKTMDRALRRVLPQRPATEPPTPAARRAGKGAR